jgi:hypothetical protein
MAESPSCGSLTKPEDAAAIARTSILLTLEAHHPPRHRGDGRREPGTGEPAAAGVCDVVRSASQANAKYQINHASNPVRPLRHRATAVVFHDKYLFTMRKKLAKQAPLYDHASTPDRRNKI